MTTPAEAIPDRDTGVLDALNIAWVALEPLEGMTQPIHLAPFLAVAFRETAGQMRALGAWLLKHHKKGALGRNKALVLAAEELEQRADALDKLAGSPTQLPIDQTERGAAVLRATADDFTPEGPKADSGQPVPPCGLTWQNSGFDPCILPDDGHRIHEGNNSKWPRDDIALSDMKAVAKAMGSLVTPNQEDIKAFLRGDVDELGTEPLFTEPRGEAQVSGRIGDHVMSTIITGVDAEKVTAGVLTGFSVAAEVRGFQDSSGAVSTNIGDPIKLTWTDSGRGVIVQPGPDPFSEPVANGGRPYWLPAPQPVAFVPPDFPRPLAVHQSDIKLAEECGLALRLKYRDRVKPVPTWWNEGGHAFHRCIEYIERQIIAKPGMYSGGFTDESARDMFNTALDHQIADVVQATGFETTYWRAANKGTEGEQWWRTEGPHMVRDYAAWSAARHAEGWSIAQVLPPGKMTRDWVPALEANFSYPDPLTGILREGTLDQIWIREAVASSGFSPGYEIELIDPKSWRKPDSDPLQLKFYAGAVASLLPNVPIASLRAAYYDGRAGITTDYIDPETALSEEEVSYRTAMVDAMHATNVYPANPGTEYGKPCGICEFRYACPIMARRDAV